MLKTNLFWLLNAALTILFISSCNLSTETQKPEDEIPIISTATPSPINATVKITSDEEIVYDWSSDKCADGPLPDLPVRAFRDAQGMIQMNLSHVTNYRLIGTDFNSLKTDCKVTLASTVDPDPSQYSFDEWMGSTYTLDGQTIYALIHNEWYGKEASRWNSIRDYSKEQATNGWHYQTWIGSEYKDMTYDAARDLWQGSYRLCQIGKTWMHPDQGCASTRTWISPVDGEVTVSGRVSDSDPGGGNGVSAIIFKNDEQLWTGSIDNGDSVGQPYNLKISVQIGDRLHFRVDARGDSGWDSTSFNPSIDIGSPPCPSGVHEHCLMMSITSAISSDGGLTFTQPEPPANLVAVLPYQWKPDAGHYAMWQPSNIIKHPRDNYYYALIQIDRSPSGLSGFQGMCLIRTETLADPKSWRAWDGSGFNLQFVDPYVENVDFPNAVTCTAVSQPVVGALSYSLTYNTYLDRFVAVGVDVFKDPPGFYYSLSYDLVNWSPKKLVMAGELAQNTGWQTPFFAYPSLIDPESPSRSFDVTGKTPYLFFTRVNNMNPLDFDLLRVRIEFDK